MTQVPISAQVFPTDYLAHLKYRLRSGNDIANDLILSAIEQIAGTSMPKVIAKLIKEATFNIPKQKGRPQAFDATQDFAFIGFDARYRALLRRYRREDQEKRKNARSRRERLPKAGISPSERAYRTLEQRYRKELGAKDWRSLRNQHTKWKQGHFHKLDENPEPLEFDEMVDKYFPPPKSSR